MDVKCICIYVQFTWGKIHVWLLRAAGMGDGSPIRQSPAVMFVFQSNLHIYMYIVYHTHALVYVN